MYRPHAAALLSFLIPGLGQIYNREILRGLFWLIITPGIWIGSAGLLGSNEARTAQIGNAAPDSRECPIGVPVPVDCV